MGRRWVKSLFTTGGQDNIRLFITIVGRKELLLTVLVNVRRAKLQHVTDAKYLVLSFI